jgi:hypothetical protein
MNDTENPTKQRIGRLLVSITMDGKLEIIFFEGMRVVIKPDEAVGLHDYLLRWRRFFEEKPGGTL